LFSIWFKYEIWKILLKYSIFGDEYAGNLYLPKYSKYNEELPKDMRQLYIHCGLLWDETILNFITCHVPVAEIT